MSFVCTICEKIPNSHSFIKFDETVERVVYYTCPSQATNNKIDGILKHIDGVLRETKDKDWTWILDLKGFSTKQFLEINNTISIVKIINDKYSDKLQKIIIINSNSYASKIFKIIKPFFNKRIQSIIFFSSNLPLEKI